ncbi:hypothetical protein QQ008_07410 [Fulvivirgaceae bacterium BMA10]|uniref:Uncharacterized protein n=1 Tax=Splendidivirga corallicola TaxID=3051826 RepID=A0ABT8KMC0_9BACT|nr:hypothetical protein [Fulvivirgaceae bacterium BMA10]
MAKIEDLKKIEFDKIPDTYNNLTMGVKQLIEDYDNESDKALFEKEAQENIDAYFDMVKSVAPDAIPSPGSTKAKKDKKSSNKDTKIQGKNRNILLDYHNALLDIAGNYQGEESNDLEGFFENVLGALNDIIEDSKDNEIPSLVQKAVKPFYAHAEMLEDNQKIRLGTVDETDVKYRNKAVKVVDKLLEDLKIGSHQTKSSKKTPAKEVSKSKDDKDELARIEKEKTDKNEKSRRVLKKMEEYEQNIAACRAVIREHYKKKRESEPEKPKPTRRTLLKKKVLSIIKLTPEAISSDPGIIAENRKIVKATIKAFMKNWGMTNTQQVESAIDKEFDQIEDKIEEKEQRDNAHRWSRDLPDTDKIIAYEKKHNKHLLKEAAHQIVDNITEAIKLYKADKEKAFGYLQSNFDNHQLEEYLPRYILEEMKEKPESKAR